MSTNTYHEAEVSAIRAKLQQQHAALLAARDALARAIVIIQGEWGYTPDRATEWLFDKTGKHYVVYDDPESIAYEAERMRLAHEALARVLEVVG